MLRKKKNSSFIKDTKTIDKASDKKVESIDIDIMKLIQTKGGVCFKEPHLINYGTSYVKVISIYKMPSRIQDNWMRKLIKYDDTMITIDTVSKNKLEVQKAINKSIKEQEVRIDYTTNWSERQDATREKQDLQNLYDRISELGEVVKYTHFRIFVPGYNLNTVEDKVEKIISELETAGYSLSIYLNQGIYHYKSLISDLETQNKAVDFLGKAISNAGNLLGKSFPLTSEQLALGNPFHYSALNDSTGSLFGFTSSGGVFLFDPFTKAKARQQAHGVIFGMQRYGKSSLLKKLFRQRAERGDFLRVMSSSQEFTELAKEFGGIILDTDTSINPLEIFESGENDFENFTNHISKLATFFKCIKQDATDEMLTNFMNVCKEFYAKLGFVASTTSKLTGKKATSYPIFSDLLLFLEDELEKLKTEDFSDLNDVEKSLLVTKAHNLNLIKAEIEKIVNIYSQYFNRHSTANHLTSEKIVVIDIEEVKKKHDIFVAYTVNILSLFWDNCLENGRVMKELVDIGDVSYEESTKFMILMDEAHNYINDKMNMVVDTVNVFLREAPKYLGSLWFATHDLRDFYPDSDYSNAKLKTLFALTQYKVLFRQGDGSSETIDRIFKESLTTRQKNKLVKFERGQCLFVISGDSVREVKIWLSPKYEIPLYRGGN